tara:strand:- start:932 stop:1270 length:339 start_codon:yes stop_codon:yes gene_type:complete
MGYRSEIIAGVPIKDKKEALSIINEWDEIGESEDGKFFYMKADYWKWYQGYPDVDKFENFILDNEDKRFLLGLGEDGAHHTNYGDSDEHDIYVVCNVEIENPTIKWKGIKNE